MASKPSTDTLKLTGLLLGGDEQHPRQGFYYCTQICSDREQPVNLCSAITELRLSLTVHMPHWLGLAQSSARRTSKHIPEQLCELRADVRMHCSTGQGQASIGQMNKGAWRGVGIHIQLVGHVTSQGMQLPGLLLCLIGCRFPVHRLQSCAIHNLHISSG